MAQFTLQELEAEKARRQSAKGGTVPTGDNSQALALLAALQGGGQQSGVPSVTRGITNAFRTRAGLGSLAEPSAESSGSPLAKALQSALGTRLAGQLIPDQPDPVDPLEQRKTEAEIANIQSQIDERNKPDSFEDLLNRLGKAADSAKKIKNRELFNQIKEISDKIVSERTGISLEEPTTQPSGQQTQPQQPATATTSAPIIDDEGFQEIEIDDFTDEPTAAGLAAKASNDAKAAAIKQRATEVAKKDLASEELGTLVDDFFLVDLGIPRGEGGMERFTQGLSTMVQRTTRGTITGKLAAVHKALGKQLRPRLARRAGDVGNLSVVEQIAAGQILPNIFDDTDTSRIKRAFLKQLTKAFDDNSESEVKKVVREFMTSDAYDEEQAIQFTNEEDATEFATLADLPIGTELIIGGKRAVWEGP